MCTNTFGANVRSSSATVRTDNPNTQSARQTTNRTKNNVTARSVTNRTPINQKNTTVRSAVKNVSARTKNTKTISARTAINPKRVSRATTTTNVATKTFGDNYTTCRDAYFTCMDQFCANQNETYRRCVCSSRLQKIQEQESSLSKTKTSLQDFHDYNIDAIPKTAEEVIAMQNATAGEKGIKEDKSTSATTLKNIKDVLNTTKEKSITNQSNLDIISDIKSIWKTTDLIRGNDIANLSGEALYNAVNAQCYDMVSNQCTASDLKMVASAYGMYIENDCELLASDINKKTTAANAAIRTTRHEMQDARLENYDAHNSLSINECITKIKQDITADTACGQDYVHCLDFTGKYLNIDSGEPIYSTDFYQFANQISLSGDILKNGKNKTFINMLNKKQIFAKQTLDMCRDVSDNVWDEFLRQALVEISQAQQQRIQTVKHDCMQVVNQCYADKSDTLADFASDASDVPIRQALELSEELCAEKLQTCSSLYGGGEEGLELLVSTMQEITDATLAQECPALLKTYLQKICAVASNDSVHAYPYGCRTYAPGEAYYANNPQCNKETNNPFGQSDPMTFISTDVYQNCVFNYNKIYISCNVGFYLDSNHQCLDCPTGQFCPGGTAHPTTANIPDCGKTYIGSLYQMLTRYAMQNCTRTSQTLDDKPSNTILMAVNEEMTNVRATLAQELSKECDRNGGIWVDIAWQDVNLDGRHDSTNDQLLKIFYINTSANKLWGYCKPAQ